MKSKNKTSVWGEGKKVTVVLDGIDWMYEVGDAADGNTVYPDADCLKKYSHCWEGCGIVECELVLRNGSLSTIGIEWLRILKLIPLKN